jgi:hypothetical protein
MWFGDGDWIHPAPGKDEWQALVNAEIRLQILWRARDFLTIWAAMSFSRRSLLWK